MDIRTPRSDATNYNEEHTDIWMNPLLGSSPTGRLPFLPHTNPLSPQTQKNAYSDHLRRGDTAGYLGVRKKGMGHALAERLANRLLRVQWDWHRGGSTAED